MEQSKRKKQWASDQRVIDDFLLEEAPLDFTYQDFSYPVVWRNLTPSRNFPPKNSVVVAKQFYCSGHENVVWYDKT